MLRSIASVVIGYLAMAVFVMAGTIFATAVLIPGGFAAAKNLSGDPPKNYLYANLLISFAAAVLGGWLCARLAPAHPLIHAIVLAALLLVMSLVSAKSQADRQPSWYPRTIATIGVLGVVLGGMWHIWAE